MLRTPVFLGLSMAERSHRRLLVAGTYAVLGGLMAAMMAASGNVVLVSSACVVLAWNIVSGSVLGRFVANTSMPQNIRFGQLLDLGLARQPYDPEQMDERGVMVRNAACFKAYRVTAFYTMLLVLVIPGLGTMARFACSRCCWRRCWPWR